MHKNNTMTKKTDKKILDLKEVGYQNLDGKTVKINFDQKELANTLFAHANSIEMDELARKLHKAGKAEITDQLKEELITIVSQFYNRRVVEAIKSSI